MFFAEKMECFHSKSKRSLEKKGLRRNWSVFLSRKQTFSKKKKEKKVFAGLEAFFCPKNGPGYKSQGVQKSPRGGQNISRGDSCPPTSRAYGTSYIKPSSYEFENVPYLMSMLSLRSRKHMDIV